MAESVLSSLVKTDKETRDSLVSIDKTLQKIYSVQQGQAKAEAKANRRSNQDKKRKSGDKPLTKMLGLDKEAKKKKKGILGSILDGLLGPIAGLLASVSIPALLGALGLGAVGAGIFAYFKSPGFKKFVDEKIFTPIGDYLKETLPKIGDWIARELNDIGRLTREAIWKSLPPWARGGGSPQKPSATENARNETVEAIQEWWTGRKTGEQTRKLRNIKDASSRQWDIATTDLVRPSFNSGDDEIDKEKQTFYGTEVPTALKDILKASNELDGIASRSAQYAKYLKDDTTLSPEVRKEYEDKIKAEAQNKIIKEKEIAKLDEKLLKLKEKEVELLEREAKVKNFKKPNQSIFAGYQSGGPITVPGNSTGDKHPALLPPGSFVLNRNASGYQNGGIPAMLESGEKVFGPGQWGPREMMMNSAIPRFQEGGEVDPTRKPKEGEISRSALGSLIFKNGKWVDYKESDKVKKKSEPTLSQRRTSSVLDGWGAPEPKEPVKDTTKEPTIKEGKDKNNGEGGASAVIAAGKQLLKEGFTVAEHPNFDKQRGFRPEGDARVGGHSPGSLHYSNLALDVTDWRSGDWLGRTKGLAENVYQKKDDMKLTQIIHDPWGSWFGGGKEGGIGGHGTHLHLGFASGPGGDTGSLSGNGPNGGGGGISSGILDTLMGIAGPVGEFLKGAIGVIGDVFGGSDFVSMLFGSLGGGGGSDVPTGDITASSDPLTGDTQAKAKEMYEYIKDKGYSDAQAKGIVVNIQRESNFDAGAASGDDGGAGGLFQWKGSRQKPIVQKLVKDRNWKGQIDYALQEDVGPQYKSATSGMSAHEASDWWMKKWERPADPVAGSAKHAAMLKGLGFQSGGVINMKGSSGGPNISQKSENQFIDKLTSAMSPVVVPMPVGGGGGGGGSTSSGQTNSSIPALSAYPNNSVALDLAYRLSMGASFS